MVKPDKIRIGGRGVLTPNFMKTPPPQYCLTLVFRFCQPTLPHSLLPPTHTPTAHSIVLFLWLNGWSHHVWCAILLNDIMDVHMLSLRTLMRVLCNNVWLFIVCIGVSIPPSKTPLPSFLPNPPTPINCPSPPF